MLNFSFQNPTRIQFGEGKIQSIARGIPAGARVLIVYGGGSIKKNGVYDQVTEALANHTYFEFSGIEPNPTYDTIMKAVDVVKTNNIDYLLAVGGGSVIDGTKFLAAAACYEGEDPWNILAAMEPVKKALPIGVVLTLPATGSETNSGSVITRDQDKLTFFSSKLFPKFAVLDPTVTMSLSDRQIGNGVVDAFVHTIEQYLTYPVDAKVQDRFAEGLLLTLIEEGPKALGEKDDYKVRANIMWSATLALNGLIGSGVPQDWTTHMIGHELTALHHVDHARTLAIILPAVMKERREQKKDKLLQYAERVWNITEGSEHSRIDQAIEKTEAFFKEMGMPTRLSDVDVDASSIEPMLQQLEKHYMVKLSEHRDVDLIVSKSILEAAL